MRGAFKRLAPADIGRTKRDMRTFESGYFGNRSGIEFILPIPLSLQAVILPLQRLDLSLRFAYALNEDFDSSRSIAPLTAELSTPLLRKVIHLFQVIWNRCLAHLSCPLSARSLLAMQRLQVGFSEITNGTPTMPQNDTHRCRASVWLKI